LTIKSKIFAESIVCIALSAALYLITIFSLPQGGRITAGSMIPIFWLSIRRGAKIGLLTGAVFGLVVLMIEPFILHPIQVLLDYPVAFGLLGLAGFFKKLPLIGVGIGMAGRFFSHFSSGIIFFSSYVPAGINHALYSIIYNGSYILPEFIVSAVMIYILVKRGVIDIYR